MRGVEDRDRGNVRCQPKNICTVRTGVYFHGRRLLRSRWIELPLQERAKIGTERALFLLLFRYELASLEAVATGLTREEICRSGPEELDPVLYYWPLSCCDVLSGFMAAVADLTFSERASGLEVEEGSGVHLETLVGSAPDRGRCRSEEYPPCCKHSIRLAIVVTLRI
jgi:hypothetical protein